VQACTAAGIQLSTFALIEDYFYTGLKNFVDQMARAGQVWRYTVMHVELGGQRGWTVRARPDVRARIGIIRA